MKLFIRFLNSNLAQLIVIVVVALLMFGLLRWVDSQDQARALAARQVLSNQLGWELAFPDGWRPVSCEYGEPIGGTTCHWVCVKDSVYRYCTPVIQSKVEATEEATR